MNTDTMTTTATADRPAGLTVLDEALELTLMPHVLTGSTVEDVRLTTKLTVTGTADEGRQGWAALTARADGLTEASTVGVDAAQCRQLAAYLLNIADDLDARTADD